MILRDQDGNQYEYSGEGYFIDRLDVPASERGKHMREMQERHVRQQKVTQIGNLVGLMIILAVGLVTLAVAWRAVRWAYGS